MSKQFFHSEALVRRFVSCAAGVLVASTLLVAPAFACRMGTFSAPLAESDLFFIGTAASETSVAGPGDVVYIDDPPGRGEFRGQLIRVDRFAGPASGKLPADLQEVIVVPWGYDTMCRTHPWEGDAQWVGPGERGLYIASLRPAEHWVNGVPTLDLFNPLNLPYTGTERIAEMGHDTSVASLLSPDQVFDLYRALPSVEDVRTLKFAALEITRTWVLAHPELVIRPPTESLLGQILHFAARQELRETNHPVLGTWRFTLRTPGDTVYTFHARTESHPRDRWRRSLTQPSPALTILQLPPPLEGYTFLMRVTDRFEDLPVSVRSVSPRTGFINALAVGNPTTGFQGVVESSLIASAFPGDPRVQRAAAQAFQAFARRYEQGLPAEASAQFTWGSDGVLRVRQSFPLDEREELVLEGERISEVVVEVP